MRRSPWILVVSAWLVAATPLRADPGFFRSGAPELKPGQVREVHEPKVADLVRVLSPAVVNVSGDSEAEGPGERETKREEELPFRSQGSGFIVHEDGFVVTNNHVIEGSRRIVVRLLDDRNEYVARVVGKDPKTDIALLKIKPKAKLPTVYIGDSDSVEVGDSVIAIGNQFQLGQTVTSGIVSAKSRRVPSRSSGPYDSFIQTDASINPGSSGGPLFNSRGQVIGINSAIFTPGRGSLGGAGFNIGIGFSIPINIVRDVVTQLRDSGRVTRGLLGVIIQPVDADVAEALRLSVPEGALVADVAPGSPASRAGFMRRDVITGFNGRPIREHDDLPLLVASSPIGSSVPVEVVRGGKALTLRAVIEELKERPPAEEGGTSRIEELGVTIQPLDPEDARGLGMEAGGVFITVIDPGSPAERAGLKRGDIIEEFADVLIRDTVSLEAAVRSMRKRGPVLLLVRRKEGTRFLTLRAR